MLSDGERIGISHSALTLQVNTHILELMIFQPPLAPALVQTATVATTLGEQPWLCLFSQLVCFLLTHRHFHFKVSFVAQTTCQDLCFQCQIIVVGDGWG